MVSSVSVVFFFTSEDDVDFDKERHDLDDTAACWSVGALFDTNACDWIAASRSVANISRDFMVSGVYIFYVVGCK